MRTRSWLSLLSVSLVLACSASPDEVAAPGAALSRVEGETPGASEATRVRDLGRLYDDGAAHVGTIVSLTASSDGQCALSLDQVGELRLWRTVEGETRPLRMPAQGLAGMSVECDGSGAERRFRIALMDPSGGAEFWEAEATGRAERVFRLPPTRPLHAVKVLPEGAGYLALGRDGAVEWLGADGEVRERIEGAKFPVQTMSVGKEGSIILSATHLEGASNHTEARFFRVRNGALEAQGESVRIEAHPTSLHWDHQHRRAWYVERSGTPNAGKVRVVDLDDSAASMWVAMPASGFANRHGLLSNGDFVLEWDSNGVLAVDPSGKVRNLPVRGDTHTPSLWAGGRRFSGQGEYLGIEDVDGGAVFLGYRRLPSAPSAVSPDASRIVHAEGDELRIEEGDGTVRSIERGHGSAAVMKLEWYDEQTLLLFDQLGGASLVDTKTGELLDQIDLHGPFNQADVRPELGAVALRTHQWGTRQLLHIEDRAFAGQRAVLDNAAFFGVMGSGSASPAGLWTFDGHKLRRYDEAQLRDGLEQSRRTEIEEDRPHDSATMLAMNSEGRAHWLAAYSDKGQIETKLEWTDAQGGSQSKVVGRGQPIAFSLSPTGDRASVVLMSAHASRVAYLVDLGTGELKWKRKLANDALLNWAQGGEHLMAHSPGSGTQVWSAVDGETQYSRCAFEFEVRSTPPMPNGPASEYLCD